MSPRNAVYRLLFIVQLLILGLASPLGCGPAAEPAANPPTEVAQPGPSSSAAEGATTPPDAKPADAKTYPMSPEEAETLKKGGASWTNTEIREHYNRWVTTIGPSNEKWKAEGVAAAERAKRAYDVRHKARITCRVMMSDPAEVKGLQQRDQEKYGNPDGPTFEQLVESQQKKGVTGDAAFEAIVESSQRTDKETNEKHGVQSPK